MTLRERIELCKQGKYPQLIGRMKSGWLVLGDVQPLPGYCMLIADPVVGSLNDLDEAGRVQYSLDMIRAGDVMKRALGSYRINYETWCNADPVLHTHISPRYLDEPESLRMQTPRQAYDWNGSRKFDQDLDRETLTKLRDALSNP